MRTCETVHQHGDWIMANSDVASVTHRYLPMLDWVHGYRRDWFVPDVLAGLALWAVMVPEGMAYAGIVGVPPIMGLYTIVPALLAYALLGTSRQLVVGPDTATGLISAVTVGAIATQGTAEFNSLTSTLAVLIGFFFFSFGVMRMGWVASFISTPVMRGFIEGLGPVDKPNPDPNGCKDDKGREALNEFIVAGCDAS